jgi:Cu/Zn superoxide dismutase
MKRFRLVAVLVAAVTAVAVAALAATAHAAPTTFVAVLTAGDEVPTCTAATNAARGVVIFQVMDEAAGTAQYRLIANNLPGTIVAAHIHVAPKGVPGPVVQPLPPTPGVEHGVIAEGTFTNPGLLAAIEADPGNYYVNVHTDVCPSGVIRGQLGEHGPVQD